MITDAASDWPQTIDEAVQALIASLTDAQRQHIRETEWADLYQFHHGLGTAIRNRFGLWQGNRALLHSCDAFEPDDASMEIIRALWSKLRLDTHE
jgi:hypothetical protein